MVSTLAVILLAIVVIAVAAHFLHLDRDARSVLWLLVLVVLLLYLLDKAPL